MKKLIILKETYLKFLLGFSFILINNISYLNAEILTRSRPDPEIRQKIHKILQKALREEYIDVSVIIHSVLDNNPVKKDSDLIPGVKIPIKSKKIVKNSDNTMVVLAWNFFKDIKKNNSNLSKNFINIKELEN